MNKYLLILCLIPSYMGFTGTLMGDLVFSSIEDEDYTELQSLVNGKRVNLQEIFTDNYETPLHYAAYLGKIEAVEILLKSGLSINLTTPQGYTPLHFAAQQGYTDLVQLLLDKGADVNLANEDGFLPVHIAASFGKIGPLALLIEKMGKVDILGIDEVTPLQLAAQNGYNDIVKYLLNLGADPNRVAKESRGTSLHFAVHGSHPDTVQLLLEKGAEVNKTNDTGDTPFVWNGYIGNISTAKILLAAGADKTITTIRYGYNAIHTASIRGNTDLIRYFLENGIFDGSEITAIGAVALHYTAMYGRLESLNLLIPVTKNIDIQDYYGKTALFYATENSKMSSITLLRATGANPNIESKDGDSPIDIAKNMKNQAVIDAVRG